MIFHPSSRAWMSSGNAILAMVMDVSLTVGKDTSDSLATCTGPARGLVSGRESRFSAHVSYNRIGGQCCILFIRGTDFG